MKSVTDKYNDVLAGKLSPATFLEEAVKTYPKYILPINTFDDAVNILKHNNIICENAVVKINNIPATPAYPFPEYNLKNAIHYELGCKGYSVLRDDVSTELYEQVKQNCIKNLTKNPLHYIDLIDFNKDRSGADQMKPLNETKDRVSVLIDREKELNSKIKDIASKYNSSNDRQFKDSLKDDLKKFRDERITVRKALDKHYDNIVGHHKPDPEFDTGYLNEDEEEHDNLHKSQKRYRQNYTSQSERPIRRNPRYSKYRRSLNAGALCEKKYRIY